MEGEGKCFSLQTNNVAHSELSAWRHTLSSLYTEFLCEVLLKGQNKQRLFQKISTVSSCNILQLYANDSLLTCTQSMHVLN